MIPEIHGLKIPVLETEIIMLCLVIWMVTENRSFCLEQLLWMMTVLYFGRIIKDMEMLCI